MGKKLKEKKRKKEAGYKLYKNRKNWEKTAGGLIASTVLAAIQILATALKIVFNLIKALI